MTPKDLQRFWSKVIKTNNCWEWTSAKTHNGYGRFRLGDKTILSHRFSYELFKEEIPSRLQIDHLCRNRKCVNPDHLEAVTIQENILRGLTGEYNKTKTHCPQGHEYTPDNTYQYKNNRFCRECNRVCCRNYQKNHDRRIIL